MSLDVFVIGGGPAGATAARLLAGWGWSVQLAHRAAGSAEPRGIAAGAHEQAARLSRSTRYRRIGRRFHPNEGNVARWAGTRRDTPTTDAGFHVSRSAFDALLRQSARAAGVRIIDAVVREVEIGDPSRIRVHDD